jgi:3-deoxy-D-manno-octulosonate 8-phosphate phosphatase (KDO 8-P phosphatase)
LVVTDPDLLARLAHIRLLAMDVDGVLTDGSIIYSGAVGDMRAFNVSDGLGIVLLNLIGVEVAWITGRTSEAVERRAAELAVRHLRQGVHNKGAALAELTRSLGLTSADVAFVGDDWNDLPAFNVAGLKLTVANGHSDVQLAADILTEHRGGDGAVREIADAIIDAMGVREVAHLRYYESLCSPSGLTRTGQ